MTKPTTTSSWSRLCACLVLSLLGFSLVVVLAIQQDWWHHKPTTTTLQPQDDLICQLQRTLMALTGRNGEPVDEESLHCRVVVVMGETNTTTDDSRIRSGLTVALELPDAFLGEHRSRLDQGLLFVRIPGGFVQQEQIAGFGTVMTEVAIPDESRIEVLSQEEIMELPQSHHPLNNRRDQAVEEENVGATGLRTILVIRVTTDDSSPSVGATEIEDRIFSTTEFSSSSQFRDCSFGQLQFEPYDTTTPVVELYLAGTTASFTERTILSAATQALQEQLGDSDIFTKLDHAVFCMPPGTSGKPYIAYSGVGSWFSVYHDSRCAYPTTVMHELAHNMGLGHAFEDGEEYGDETTLMGFSSSSRTGPSKCFNGQNLFLLGWFPNRATMVDPFYMGSQLVELAPFVDYRETLDYQSVLVTVFDMHLVYNRAKTFNSGTPSEYADTVTISREEDDINSSLQAVMNLDHPVFQVSNVLGTGRTLIIELCQAFNNNPSGEADFYLLSIGLDESICPQKVQFMLPTSGPTAVTPQPTPVPTLPPTPAPTLVSEPEVPPTSTQMPTETPSRAPMTDMPTIKPTMRTRPPTSSWYGDGPLIDAPDNNNNNNAPEDMVDEKDVWVITHDVNETQPPMVGPFPPEDWGNVAVGLNEGVVVEEHSPTISTSIVFVVASLAGMVCVCAMTAVRYTQRKAEEQKRNARILKFNASRQVKIYMQDPVWQGGESYEVRLQ